MSIEAPYSASGSKIHSSCGCWDRLDLNMFFFRPAIADYFHELAESRFENSLAKATPTYRYEAFRGRTLRIAKVYHSFDVPSSLDLEYPWTFQCSSCLGSIVNILPKKPIRTQIKLHLYDSRIPFFTRKVQLGEPKSAAAYPISGPMNTYPYHFGAYLRYRATHCV